VSARVDVVVPTVGRRSLAALLDRLAADAGMLGRVVVVDDRPPGHRSAGDLSGAIPPALRERTLVLRSGGRGPAAARNTGWRATTAPWVVFLDDDVVPRAGWVSALADDVVAAGPRVGAVAADLHVPLPAGRRPTDRERQVKALETAGWITADLVVRRAVLEHVGGFDERFPRAHREDTDLALRVQSGGWQFERGHRRTDHPVQPAPWWHSVAAQRGNRDDVLMYVLHRWRPDRTRRRRHAWITACGVTAIAAAACGRRRVAILAALGWAAGTAEFLLARVLPGPRTAGEMSTMLATTVAIPPVAVAHRWRAHIALWRGDLTRGAAPVRDGTAP
jgi:GT2 family glycosyltransferase